MTTEKLWEAVDVSVSEDWWAKIGQTTLWLRRKADEIHVAAKQNEQDQVQTQALQPESPSCQAELAWKRWVISKEIDQLRLAPAMPDRSVVVRPEQPVTLPPRSKADFYVRVPLWLRILVRQKTGEEQAICEEPSLVLSNTWFGDTMSGELCYSMRTTARRQVEPSTLATYRAICPVTVANESTEDLLIERICVRVAHLRIYQEDGILWTGRVSASFRGADHASRLKYHTSAPPQAPKARQITAERKPAGDNIIRRTFLSLRSVVT